jgi:hypothetical protein
MVSGAPPTKAIPPQIMLGEDAIRRSTKNDQGA